MTARAKWSVRPRARIEGLDRRAVRRGDIVIPDELVTDRAPPVLCDRDVAGPSTPDYADERQTPALAAQVGVDDRVPAQSHSMTEAKRPRVPEPSSPAVSYSSDVDELITLCSETICQDAPQKFHSALHVALASFDAVRSAHDLFGEALPPDVFALHAVISTSQVTKLKGQIRGCLAELSDKHLKF